MNMMLSRKSKEATIKNLVLNLLDKKITKSIEIIHGDFIIEYKMKISEATLRRTLRKLERDKKIQRELISNQKKGRSILVYHKL